MRVRVVKVLMFGCVALSLCLMSGRVSAAQLIKADAALKNLFPAASVFDPKPLVLTEQQIAAIGEGADVAFDGSHSGEITTYTAKDGARIIGYAFEDTVIGKWGPIHYLVALNIDGAVIQVVILDYKEIRGRPIAKKRFLNQYKGKTARDKIVLRSDIDGVTGATISSRSLTDGVRKIVHINELIKAELAKQ